MATQEQIEQLKRDWLADPVWDIEDTDGFEEHRNELYKYRLEVEEDRLAKRLIRLHEKAEAIGCPENLRLAEYVMGLERQIAELSHAMGEAGLIPQC